MSVALGNPQSSVALIQATRSRRSLVLALLVALLSLGLARLVLSFDIFAAAGLVALIAFVAIVLQPRHGLYLVFAIVLLFEGASDDPLMTIGVYLNNSLQSTFHATGAILTPLELLLLTTAGMWLVHGLMHHRLEFRSGALGMPALLFFFALVFGVVRGTLAGGIFNFVFWESRFLFYLVLCYVLAVNTLRKPAHVRTLLTLVFVCVSLNGVESVWRKFALADTGMLGQVKETWYSHEDVVIWGLLIMLVVAQQTFGAPRWQRVLGPIAAACSGYAMLASERRAGYIAVMIAFVAVALVLLMVKRKAFFIIAVPVFIVMAVYLPLFWNNTGTFGQPARAIRSLYEPDIRDASSNAYRDLEAINVRATIAADPLVGVGFGQPFLQVVAVPDISFFEFWNYEAHHNIMWVWMKVGAIGFILFFALMLRGLALASYLAKVLTDRDARVFALVTLAGIVMSLVYCYVDIGLTSSRIPVLLGTTLGVLGVLHQIYPVGSRQSVPRKNETPLQSTAPVVSVAALRSR